MINQTEVSALDDKDLRNVAGGLNVDELTDYLNRRGTVEIQCKDPELERWLITNPFPQTY